MNPLAERIGASPELFAHTMNVGNGTVSLLRLTESDYRAASFLDGRLLSPASMTRAIGWPDLAAAVSEARLNERCDFIFHIGHVGSTLLSRLLGEHPAVFALREPQVLRTLAQSRFENPADLAGLDERLSVLLKLLSRTFRPEQHALVKATSFVSEIAPEILVRPYRPRGIFLFVPAEVFLAGILGGPNSRQEARMLAPSRQSRLERRLGETIETPQSEGEFIAMGWACEMVALGAAATDDRVIWMDFERFLSDPAAQLLACFRHLGIAATESEAQAIVSGQEMRRYAKAQEYAYDPALRRAVLDQARAQSAAEIRRGLEWLERAARRFPKIAAAQSR